MRHDARGRINFQMIKIRWAPWVDVVKIPKRDHPTKGFIRQVAVRSGVYQKNEGRKVSQNASFQRPHEPTTRLLQVSMKAMKRDSKPRHIKGVPDKDKSSIKGNNSIPAAQNGA